MKRGSNITVKNVLQVYVTETAIFYVISSKKVRTSHTLTGAGGGGNGDIKKIHDRRALPRYSSLAQLPLDDNYLMRNGSSV